MKNSRVILTSLCVLFTTVLIAQSASVNPRENVVIGLKAGINSSNVWDEQGQDFEAESKIGFAGGLFLGIPIGEILGLQPEILISQKGFQGSGTLLATPYSFSRTTTYLDFPIQLQLKPTDVLTLVGGPQYSYLLHKKDVYTFGTNSSAKEEEFDNENIRKNTLGLVFGADLIFSSVVVSGRAGWDFQTNNGDGTSSTPRYKNEWFQLTIGLKL